MEIIGVLLFGLFVIMFKIDLIVWKFSGDSGLEIDSKCLK